MLAAPSIRRLASRLSVASKTSAAASLGASSGTCVLSVSAAETNAWAVASDNVPAQRSYEALGYEVIGDYALVFFRDPQDIP